MWLILINKKNVLMLSFLYDNNVNNDKYFWINNLLFLIL
jgi:hypothetical protein